MSDDLKTLAHRLYLLARRDVWLGGRGDTAKPWPKEVERPAQWNSSIFWTLSPEITLGGHQLRVCISSRFRSTDPGSIQDHAVRVFVDGELKHPGGFYVEQEYEPWTRAWPFDVLFGLETWSAKIARQEREDGGRTGPIDVRDLLIAEAADRLNGVRKLAEPLPDEAALRAAREVEALVQGPAVSVSKNQKHRGKAAKSHNDKL